MIIIMSNIIIIVMIIIIIIMFDLCLKVWGCVCACLCHIQSFLFEMTKEDFSHNAAKTCINKTFPFLQTCFLCDCAVFYVT